MSAQHYLFAHRILPADLWNGDALLGILASPENQHYLHILWNDIPKMEGFQAFCARRSQPMPLPSLTGEEEVFQPPDVARVGPPDGLSYQSFWLGGQHLVVLVTMPPPDSGGEAHFIAVTYSPRIEYLVLERGIAEGTMLCGWRPDRHVNHGPGPEPDAGQFLRAVCRHLGIPETVESPMPQQVLRMSKEATVNLTMPAPLPPTEAAQVEQWEKAAEDAQGGAGRERGPWWKRWLKPADATPAQLAEAESLYRRIYELRLRVQGVENTEATLAALPLVTVLNAQGKHAEALALCEEWWLQCRRYRVPGHHEALLATQQLAGTLRRLGQEAAAGSMWSYRAHFFGLTRGKDSTQAQIARKELELFASTFKK